MATKKISIYSALESTPNQKVEDLYLIVDNSSIILSVKNKKTRHVVAIEHFENNSTETSWQELDSYLQNNSKLVAGIYGNIYFVLNSSKFILTNKLKKEDTLIYQDELNMIHDKINEEELYVTPYNDNLVIVFTVPDGLSTMLSRVFPSGKWHHYVAYILACETKSEVLIYLFENQFCIRITIDGKLQYINYFSLVNHDRNCYHILNACSNTNIKTNVASLKILGYDPVQHPFINKLATYFSVAEIVETPYDGIGVNLNVNYPQNIYSTYFIF